MPAPLRRWCRCGRKRKIKITAGNLTFPFELEDGNGEITGFFETPVVSFGKNPPEHNLRMMKVRANISGK